MLFTLYPKASQITAVDSSFDLVRDFTFWLWYVGRLIATAHWLPAKLSTQPETWEVLLGVLGVIGVGWSVYRRLDVSVWGVWSLVTLLPFINNPNTIVAGPSRYLYLASVGTSVLLAWGIWKVAHAIFTQQNSGRLFVCTVLGALCVSSAVALHRAEALGFYNSGRAAIAREHLQMGAEQYARAIQRDQDLIPAETYHRYATAMFGLGKSPDALIGDMLLGGARLSELRALLGVSAFLAEDDMRHAWGREQVLKEMASESMASPIRHRTALALQNLATYFQTQEHFERAIALYDLALTLKPDYPIVLYNMGSALFHAGDVSAAEEKFRAALTVDGRYVDAWKDLGNLCYQQKRFDEAISAYERAVEIAPRDVDMLQTLGILYHQQKKLAQAIQIYDRVLTLDSSRIMIWRNLGVAHHAQGNLKSAVRAYREGVARNRHDVALRNNLGGALFALGHVEDAVLEYKTSMRIDPSNAVARKNLSVILAQKMP